MTEIALDREQSTVELPKLSLVVLILFMTIALGMSAALLNWAVGEKLAKLEPAESSTITVAVRERQLGCLARNIYYEAGREPFEGKVAVAQVTLNRVESGKFPDDICKTIYQKNIVYEKVICQFSWACDRDAGRPPNNDSYTESMEVAKKVLLEDFRLPALKDAMYYHADYINPGWHKERLVKIGHHIFYK
jgi:spore germination cell wall hydrolase CwlJ-like protein